ncbi:MAG: hypothetical protein ACXQTZ_02910 [Candidatus Alkanophagales archaeon]
MPLVPCGDRWRRHLRDPTPVGGKFQAARSRVVRRAEDAGRVFGDVCGGSQITEIRSPFDSKAAGGGVALGPAGRHPGKLYSQHPPLTLNLQN